MLGAWIRDVAVAVCFGNSGQRLSLAGVCLLGTVALGGCGEKESASDDADTRMQCETGDEGCACYPNKTCNGDLSCYSKKCVDDSALDADDADDTQDTSKDDADAGGSPSAQTDDAGDPSEPQGSDDPSNTEPDTAQEPDSQTDDATDPNVTDPDEPTAPTMPNEPTAPSETPVALHGQLHVQGTQLTDEHGVAVQLKGISSMWLNWEPTGYAESLEGLRWMRDNWKLQIIRAAMGVAERPGDGAYLEDPAKAKAQVRAIVQNAIDLGVYVIIDWHDHHAQDNQAEAEAFFAEMAQEYADVPNVLYEVYNEPLDVDWDSVLRPYHVALSAVIREYTNNVVILGTPNWSQDVDIAALNPVAGTNLMYTLHFYACDHTDTIRAKGASALANGLPIFVTEWGGTPADGGAETPLVCEPEATAWHDWMDSEKISWAAWKLDGCGESSCIFVDRNVPVDGGWTSEMLNGHAPFVISRMQTVQAPSEPEPPTMPNNGCEPTGSCTTADRTYCDADGVLSAADCSACALLGCTSCCESVGYFGAVDTQGTFAVDQSLITGFTQSATSAVLEVEFTGIEQTGAIAFSLASPQVIDPYAVSLSLTAEGGDAFVTLENGASGCLYPLDADSVGIYLLVDSAVCWGSALPGDSVTQINVRVDSLSSGSATLAFSGIAW